MKATDTRQGHANSPDWVMAESIRRCPHDLAERIDWIHEMIHSCVSESDRHELCRRLRRMLNGI